MSKSDVIEIEGTVKEKLPNAMFKVELENGLEVLEEVCPLSARMIVNPVSMQMETERIKKLVNKLREKLSENI